MFTFVLEVSFLSVPVAAANEVVMAFRMRRNGTPRYMSLLYRCSRISLLVLLPAYICHHRTLRVTGATTLGHFPSRLLVQHAHSCTKHDYIITSDLVGKATQMVQINLRWKYNVPGSLQYELISHVVVKGFARNLQLLLTPIRLDLVSIPDHTLIE